MGKWMTGVRRMLTGLLSVAMIVTALPSYTFAAEIPADDTALAVETQIPEETEEYVVIPGADEQEDPETAPEEEADPEIPADDAEDPAVYEEIEPAEDNAMDEGELLTDEAPAEEDAEQLRSAGDATANIVTMEGFELDPRGFVVDYRDGDVEAYFATANATEKEDQYVIKNKVKAVTFTVTTPLAYEPDVNLCEVDDDGACDTSYRVNVSPEKVAKDKTGKNRINTYMIGADDLAGHGLWIAVNDAYPRDVVVEYDPAALTDYPSAVVDGTYLDPSDSDENHVVYSVDDFKTVTITATPEAEFKFAEVTLNGKAQAAAVKTGTVTFTVTDYAEVSYVTKGIQTLEYYDGHGNYVPIANGTKVPLASNDAGIKVAVYEGKNQTVLTEIKAMNGGNEVPGFATGEPAVEPTEIKIDASKAAASKAQSVALTFKSGTQSYKLNFTVAQTITNVKPKKGFTYDSKNKEYHGEQVMGTVVEYPLAVEPKGADVSRLDCRFVCDTPATAWIGYEGANNPVLYVATAEDDELTTKPVTVFIVDKADASIQYGDPIVITPVPATTFAAPTVKVMQATDTYMTLSLDLPKALQDYANLAFKVEAEAKEHVDGMKDSDTFYFPAWEDCSACRIVLAEDGTPGQGHEQSYTLRVSVIQVKDSKLDPSVRYEPDNIQRTTKSKSKELKNQKTKEPYYESKLTLIKKTTAVTIGEKGAETIPGTDEEGILLATPKFSASTSFAEIADASIIYGRNCVASSNPDNPNCVLKIDGNGGIWLTGWTDDMSYPDTFTLTVTAAAPEGDSTVGAYATMPITFRPAVTGVDFEIPSKTLFKAPNRAATVKIKATPYSEYVNPKTGERERFKPANSKLIWDIDFECEETLYHALRVNNNGVVTVNKNYIVSSVVEDNFFDLEVYSADLLESFNDDLEDFQVAATTPDPTSMWIGGVQGVAKAPEQQLSNVFDGSDFVIKNENGDDMYLANMTVTVTPATGLRLTFDPDLYGDFCMKASVQKVGTYTIKATVNDGSKKTITGQFAVKSDEVESYSLSVFGKALNAYDFEYIPLETGEATISGTDLIIVDPSPCGVQGGLVECKAAVKARSGAKKVDISGIMEDGGTRYIYLSPYAAAFKPTANQAVFEFSTGVKNDPKETITINIANRGVIKPNAKGYSFYSHDHAANEFEMGLQDVTVEDRNDLRVVFTPADKAYASLEKLEAAEGLAEALSDFLSLECVEDPETHNLTGLKLKSAGGPDCNPMTAFDKGTYTFNITLFEADSGGKRALTAPAQITFKVTDAPKPVAALKKAVTYDLDTADPDKGVKLEFQKKQNVLEYGQGAAYACIVNGESTKFDEYFEVQNETDGLYLRIKSAAEPPAGQTVFMGMIGYMAVGMDGNIDQTYMSFMDPVTVTVKRNDPE